MVRLNRILNHFRDEKWCSAAGSDRMEEIAVDLGFPQPKMAKSSTCSSTSETSKGSGSLFFSRSEFTWTLDKNLAINLFKLLLKYRSEDQAAKKERLLKRAQAEAEGKTIESKKLIVMKYGLNHITYLIKHNKAQLVVIAHDVDPIELVVWLPALCRKMEIPYCIVDGKSRLGAIAMRKLHQFCV